MNCIHNINCLYSNEQRAQNIRNKVLERELQFHKRLYTKRIKLLLLGNKGSGKTTFLHQLHLANDKKYYNLSRLEFVRIIHQNIFRSMQIIIDAMKRLDIPYEDKERSTKNAALIIHANLCYPPLFLNIFLKALKELWADAGIQECYLRNREYDVMESTKYFFNNLDRIADPNYIPTEQDMLRARVPSEGFQEHIFNYKNVEFLVTNVGLQRSRRMKWMHCFDNVTAIIYIIAISEYDQYTFNSTEQRNALKDSLELLRTVAYNECFSDIAIILVFNKLDIFEEKIMYSNLVDYFPEYTGPRYDPLAARNFILNKCLSVIPKKSRIYYYFLSSIEVENESMTFIYRAIRDTVLNINLQYFNLV